MGEQCLLQVAFLCMLAQQQEVEVVGILEKLLGEFPLWFWRLLEEIGWCLALALVGSSLYLSDEISPAPALLDGLLYIPFPGYRIQARN